MHFYDGSNYWAQHYTPEGDQDQNSVNHINYEEILSGLPKSYAVSQAVQLTYLTEYHGSDSATLKISKGVEVDAQYNHSGGVLSQKRFEIDIEVTTTTSTTIAFTDSSTFLLADGSIQTEHNVKFIDAREIIKITSLQKTAELTSVLGQGVSELKLSELGLIGGEGLAPVFK